MGFMDKLIDEVLSAPPARGRRQSAGPQAMIVRDLTEEDVRKLWGMKDGDLSSEPPPRQKLKHAHHNLARLLASGVPHMECHYQTGYNISTISILLNDPSFKDLVEYYKSQVNEQFLNVHERLASLSMDVVTELQDRLENEPDEFTNSELKGLLETTLDRTGHGPTSSVNHRGVVGFVTPDQLDGLKQELAQRRLGQVRPLGLAPPAKASDNSGTSSGPILEHEPLAQSSEPTWSQGPGADLPEKSRP